MAEAKRIERPLSPFMFVQYYRLQLTAVTSVMIRITGNALMVATLLVVWWLLALAAGPDHWLRPGRRRRLQRVDRSL